MDGRRYSPAELAAAAERAGWPAARIATAVAVALAESNGRMVANNAAGETPSSLKGRDVCASYGPWQINYCRGRDAGSARQQAANSNSIDVHAQVALGIYRSQGFSAWTMFTNGVYLTRMAEGLAAAAGRGGHQVGPPSPDAPPPDQAGQAPTGTTARVGGAPFDLLPSLPIVGDLDVPLWRAGQIVGGLLLVAVGLLLIARELSPAGSLVDAAANIAQGATDG